MAERVARETGRQQIMEVRRYQSKEFVLTFPDIENFSSEGWHDQVYSFEKCLCCCEE